MAKVFISAGHGGKDPGAIGNGYNEKDLTLAISKYCASALKRCGVQYKMSRTKDVAIEMNDTVSMCNKYKPDVAIAIHLNAFDKKAIGSEVYCSMFSQKGRTLATYVLNNIITLGVKSRGVKTKSNSSGRDYFAFNRETEATAILIECCFIDSTDIQFVNTKAKQKAMGEAIAKGVCEYLNVKYITEEKQESDKTDNKLYRVQVGAFSQKENAENLLKQLKEKGFDGIIV